MKFHLVEAPDAILPEVGPEMGVWTLEQLRKRGIDVKLADAAGVLRGRSRRAVRRHRVRRRDGRVDRRRQGPPGAGRTPTCRSTSGAGCVADANLQVVGTDERLGCRGRGGGPGPDQPDGNRECAPNAQHAVRQSKVLADNIVATLRGFPLHEYKHKYVGSVAGLGLYKGVANVYGIKVKGVPGLVHAPDLPREPGADPEPQDPGDRRLDHGAVLQARDRLAVVDARAVHRVPGCSAPPARRTARSLTRRSGPWRRAPALTWNGSPGWRNWQPLTT